MTLLPPSLRLNRLVVFGNGRVVYDESFHVGVNIIRGSNSSGKSTIADFIFFALGGDVSGWKPEAERCDYVMAEIAINGSPVTVRRQVATASRQAMHLYWGPYDAARQSAVEGWQTYSFQRSPKKESFSQALFRALQLPEVKGDLESNITMHQVMRLLYVDQLSSVESLMRDEDFDSPLTRRTVGEMLLGGYDDSLYTDELALRSAQRELDDVTQQVNSLIEVLTEVEGDIDLDRLSADIVETERRHQRVIQALVVARIATTAVPTATNTPTLEQLRERVVAQRQLLADALNKTTRQELEVEDSREFIAALERRLRALDQSIAVRDTAGELPLTHCPQCLSPLVPVPDDSICILCRQPLPKQPDESQALRMRQELSVQIKESAGLLADKEQALVTVRRSIPALQSELRVAESTFDDAAQRVTTPRDEEIDQLLIEKGSLEAQLQSRHKQAKAFAVLRDARTRKARLTSNVQDLVIAIKAKRDRQAGRLREAEQKVSGYAVQLLKSDLRREEWFNVAQSVTLDFGKNTFAVDGRNRFSASSMVYLKNSVHFGILFSSLDLAFFRYPRFLLCDNMEDKGMEEIRSQNFQRAIVKMAAAYDVEHQIVFTTSMIAPELDTSELCVGDKYSLEHHSLNFGEER